jgi:hypothetical protein
VLECELGISGAIADIHVTSTKMESATRTDVETPELKFFTVQAMESMIIAMRKEIPENPAEFTVGIHDTTGEYTTMLIALCLLHSGREYVAALDVVNTQMHNDQMLFRVTRPEVPQSIISGIIEEEELTKAARPVDGGIPRLDAVVSLLRHLEQRSEPTKRRRAQAKGQIHQVSD